MKRRLVVAARVVFSLALLAYVLTTVSWGDVRSRLGHAEPLFLLLFACILPVNVFLSAWKWKILLESQGFALPLGRLYRFYVVGQFYNHVLPGAVGGDVVRATLVRPALRTRYQAYGSVFLERMTGLVVLLLLAAAALAATPALRRNALLAGAVLVATAICVLWTAVVLRPGLLAPFAPLGRTRLLGPLLGKLARFREHLREYRGHPRTLAACLALSVAFYALTVLNLVFASRGIGHPIELWKAALVVPIAQLVALFPIAINGLGVLEWAIGFSLSALNASAAVGVACSLLMRARNVIWSAAGYAIHVARSRA